MDRYHRARLTGTIGIAATVAWLANWTYLLITDSAATIGSTAWYTGQALSAPAVLGTTITIGGLWWTRTGGAGRFARLTLGAWTTGFLLVFAGTVITITSANNPVNPLLPLGGMLATVAGIAGGIVMLRAKVLDTWRRWAPLTLALWYGLVLGGVMAVAEHSWLATAAELATYLMIGLTAIALRTARLAQPSPAGQLQQAAA